MKDVIRRGKVIRIRRGVEGGKMIVIIMVS